VKLCVVKMDSKVGPVLRVVDPATYCGTAFLLEVEQVLCELPTRRVPQALAELEPRGGQSAPAPVVALPRAIPYSQAAETRIAELEEKLRRAELLAGGVPLE
jgi:hypothetical protein